MPYLLPSRPKPLCLTPPNLEAISTGDLWKEHGGTYGEATSLMRPVFTPTIPTSKASATRKMRLTLPLKK